jgi:hypothetical protein
MKSFIYSVSIFTTSILLILLPVNYFGDSAHIFKVGYELKMAEIIEDGKNVTNIDNYDERIFQKEIINHMNYTPKTIVLGTSTSMLINRELLKENNFFFNNSVSGSSLEDIVAIYQIYKENNKIPKKIIIGIAPYMFNKNNGKKRWKSIEEFYYHFKNENYEKSNTYKYKELFSFSYFQSSLAKLPDLISGNNKPKATDKKFNKTNTKLTDGTMIYGESYRDASKSEIERKIKSKLAGDLYGVENFYIIDKDIWAEFEELIFDMKNNNIEIEFFLAPYHPEVYNRIKDNYPMVLKSEKIIVKSAKAHDIKFYGSFNPSKMGLDGSSFYDGNHCKETGIKKILQPIE